MFCRALATLSLLIISFIFGSAPAFADVRAVDLKTSGLDPTCLQPDAIIIREQNKLISPQASSDSEVISREEQAKLTHQMRRRIQTCNAPLFSACYPRLEPSISEDNLKNLFSSWLQNPLYRMKDGYGMCAQRAYALARELSDRGYEVKQIEYEAPGIGAWSFNKLGQRAFADKYDNHTVVSIKTRTAQGTVEMVLDPQFQNTPVEISSYERLITGTECVIAHDDIQIWECVKMIHPANWQSDRRPPSAVTAITDDCGWPLAERYKKDQAHANRMLEQNQIQISADDASLLSSENPQRALVASAWKERIDYFQSQLASLKGGRISLTDVNVRHLVKRHSSIADLEKDLDGWQKEYKKLFND